MSTQNALSEYSVSERPQCSVAYVFDALNPRAVAYTFSNYTHPIEPGQTVNFDPLVFPYAFSAAAYYYVLGKEECRYLLLLLYV